MAVHTRTGPDSPDACPAWCRRAHAAGDHPDDRHHQSRVHLVAVVTGRPTLEPEERAQPVVVAVRLVRRTGSALTWIEMVSEEGAQVRLVLTAESARHLLATAGELLTEATG